MRSKWLRVATAFLFVGMVFSAAVVQGDDASYWSKFKSVFVDWDDDAKPGSAQTQTVGVRGIGVEESLGASGYDWQAVKDMEEFKVKMTTEKAFLQEAKLGPFQEN